MAVVVVIVTLIVALKSIAKIILIKLTIFEKLKRMSNSL